MQDSDEWTDAHKRPSAFKRNINQSNYRIRMNCCKINYTGSKLSIFSILGLYDPVFTTRGQ